MRNSVISMHLGCGLTFGKRKNRSPAAREFLLVPKVSPQLACMDDAILQENYSVFL